MPRLHVYVCVILTFQYHKHKDSFIEFFADKYRRMIARQSNKLSCSERVAGAELLKLLFIIA